MSLLTDGEKNRKSRNCKLTTKTRCGRKVRLTYLYYNGVRGDVLPLDVWGLSLWESNVRTRIRISEGDENINIPTVGGLILLGQTAKKGTTDGQQKESMQGALSTPEEFDLARNGPAHRSSGCPGLASSASLKFIPPDETEKRRNQRPKASYHQAGPTRPRAENFR